MKWCVLLLLVAACQTGNKQQEDGVPLRLESDEGAAESVPAFLWSPSRRKATAGYHFLVAEYMLLHGELGKARPLYESSYNLDSNPFLASKLIATEAALGNVEGALPEARKMVLLYPKNARLHFLYGTLLARRGMRDQAMAEIEKAIDLDPTTESYYLELALMHQVKGDYPAAIVILKDLVKAVPTSYLGWGNLAKLYLVTSQRKKALAPAKKAYELQSSNPEFVLVYAITLEMNKQSKKAIALYEQLYRLNPTNEELISRMISQYRSIGDLKESLALLNELAKLPGGQRPGVQLQRAIILWELKRFEEASAILNQLSESYPDQKRLTYMAGLGQEKLRQLDRALATFRSVPEGNEFFISSQIRIAVILRAQKKYRESTDTIEKLVKYPNTDHELYVLGAGIYADDKKFADAIRFLKRGYEKFPTKHRLLFLVGVYQEKSGDIKSTIATMRLVIKVDSTNSSAYNYLGYLFAERGENLEEAEKLILRALELKPNDGYYLDSLGWVYYQKKQYKKALPVLQRSLKIVPEEGVVMEHIADVYLKLGDTKTALDYYRRAVKARLDERDKLRVEKKLADMVNRS